MWPLWGISAANMSIRIFYSLISAPRIECRSSSISKQTWIFLDSSRACWGGCIYVSLPTCVPTGVLLYIMDSPLLPRESGQFIAERSRDVFVEEEGVTKVAEMLYSLRHDDVLTASCWKTANPLAPAPTSDQGSPSTAGATQRNL